VDLFLTSDKPEEILLAILSNFGSNSPEEVIRGILQKIERILGKGLLLQKYTRQLQILSMLRKLQPQTNKIIQNMSLTIDIREDIVYKQGILDAKEEVIIKMLAESNLTIAQIANFLNVEEAIVERIKKTLHRKKR
jgi:hypothetical protein